MSIHLVGVGGAGMSGIARVLAQRGQVVTGCDREATRLTKTLIAEGIACTIGHSAEHAETAERLIVSGAIADDAPELVRARELGLPIQHRAEALADILREHAARVVVTGAHGKTTTSAMLAAAAVYLGLDPTFVVGGDVRQLGTNARGGSDQIAIVEGDESDRSVRQLPATIGVILNVDFDHLDHYDSVEDVVALLGEWADTVPTDGLIVLGDGVAITPAAEVARFGVGYVDRSERTVETQYEPGKSRIGRQQVRAETDHSDGEVLLLCPSQHRQEGQLFCRLCQVLRQTARADRRVATERHVRDHSLRQRTQWNTARAIWSTGPAPQQRIRSPLQAMPRSSRAAAVPVAIKTAFDPTSCAIRRALASGSGSPRATYVSTTITRSAAFRASANCSPKAIVRHGICG